MRYCYRNVSEHLNESFFRNLHSKLPGFKRDYAAKRGEQRSQSNGTLKQPPCLVCGKYFGSKSKEFQLAPNKTKPFCPSCKEHLDAGCAVFTTTDLHGYAIVRLPNVMGAGALQLDTSKLNGKISLVTWEEMQLFTAKPVDPRKVFAFLSRLIAEIPDTPDAARN